MVEDQKEMKCPKCGGDMKEYVTERKSRKDAVFLNRHMNCIPSTL
jgi:hypothetical protein